MMRFVVLGLLLLASPAVANDSIAELKTGGLVLGRTDAITMAREDLFVSLDKVQVSYTFRNHTNQDIDTIVAFPMPDIQVNPLGDTALPVAKDDNFLDFSAQVDGQPVTVTLEQRAHAARLDVTADLAQHVIPLFPFSPKAEAALAKLPDETIHQLQARGLVRIETYDTGSGMQEHRTPAWVLKSTYWWRMTFPAGLPVRVDHSYRPSVGGSVGVNFFEDGKFGGSAYDDYARRYCMDAAFERAIQRRMRERKMAYPPFSESRISYVLMTAANWAGTVGKYKLTVDKTDPQNLVSFCGKNVRKLNATTFEMSVDDFYPERDLDILFLKPTEK
jgi:hypothetical protein